MQYSLVLGTTEAASTLKAKRRAAVAQKSEVCMYLPEKELEKASCSTQASTSALLDQELSETFGGGDQTAARRCDVRCSYCG